MKSKFSTISMSLKSKWNARKHLWKYGVNNTKLSAYAKIVRTYIGMILHSHHSMAASFTYRATIVTLSILFKALIDGQTIIKYVHYHYDTYYAKVLRFYKWLPKWSTNDYQSKTNVRESLLGFDATILMIFTLDFRRQKML